MSVLSTRKTLPIQRQPLRDQFRSDIATVGKKASCNKATVRPFARQLCRDHLPLADADHRPFGFLTPGILDFRRIYPRKAYLDLLDDNRVSIDDVASAF